MKILLVHNYYREPGGEDVVFAQERALLERNGHSVITYTRSNDEADNSSALDRIRLLKTIVSADDSRKQMERIIRAEKPDLAHIHNTFMMISPSIYETLASARIPTVQTVHNYRMMCPAAYLFRNGKVCEECITHGLMSSVRHGCYRNSRANTAAVAMMLKFHRAIGTFANHVHAFISLSDFAKEKMIRVGISATRIHVKTNFVADDPGERKVEGDYALFVGRLSPEKGVDVILKAWKLLQYPYPLRIVGDGPIRADLERQAQQVGLPENVFMGRLTKKEIQDVMKKAKFLILPSLWYEGVPIVLAESFACGVPVIGSRLGAVEENIDDSHTGLHFTAGSPDDLASKVTWAWEHSIEMEAMGRNARLKYEQKYKPEVNYNSLMDIYLKAEAQAALDA